MKHLGFYTGYRKAHPEKPSSYLLVTEKQEEGSFLPYWHAWNPYMKTLDGLSWGPSQLGKSKGILSVPIEYLT